MSGLLAFTRAVSPRIANCELTFITREPIDLAKASEQHHLYTSALSQAGLSVITLPASDSRLAPQDAAQDPGVLGW